MTNINKLTKRATQGVNKGNKIIKLVVDKGKLTILRRMRITINNK